MQMEYLVDDVAVATNLQILARVYISIATFWTYDYACSVQEEWTFLHRSRSTKIKVLFIITRHVPFSVITMGLCLKLTTNESLDECRMLLNIYSVFSQISITFSEFFFVLRTCALWNNSRIILATMLFILCAGVAISIGIRSTDIASLQVTASAIPGIPGCYSSSPSVQFVSYILLFVCQLVLVSLTLIRVIQSWRSAKGHLRAVLEKHNMLYYACALFLSAMSVLMPMLFSNSPYYSIVKDLQIFILAILATRMHLHLWHIDRHIHGSDALVYISMTDVSPEDITV
ncbi:hypothetical protein EDB19DRAFT_698939 [Suillus lakei]|nr:hypothetical protein EDB19DRAFT_698939 [Suillus lakei]